jgi:hypothetical protein
MSQPYASLVHASGWRNTITVTSSTGLNEEVLQFHALHGHYQEKRRAGGNTNQFFLIVFVQLLCNCVSGFTRSP